MICDHPTSMGSPSTAESKDASDGTADGAGLALACAWIERAAPRLLASGQVKPGTLVADAVQELVAALTLALRADAVPLVSALAGASEDLVRTHEGRSLQPWIEGARALVLTSAPPEARPLLLALLASAESGLARGADTSVSYLPAEGPRRPVAASYLEALLRGDRRRASGIVTEQLARGATLRDLYAEVFAPVQREVGRLWQRGEISIADEHFCTAATQLVMAQLYDRLFEGERRRATLVATSAPGDLHEVGIRIVADFFEMRGWDTVYLGANTPAGAVAEAAVRHRADLVAVSATRASHVEGVRDVVREVRARAGQVPVLVGGQPFQLAPGLVAYVGADACAATAEAAVLAAEALLGERRGPAGREGPA